MAQKLDIVKTKQMFLRPNLENLIQVYVPDIFLTKSTPLEEIIKKEEVKKFLFKNILTVSQIKNTLTNVIQRIIESGNKEGWEDLP